MGTSWTLSHLDLIALGSSSSGCGLGCGLGSVLFFRCFLLEPWLPVVAGEDTLYPWLVTPTHVNICVNFASITSPKSPLAKAGRMAKPNTTGAGKGTLTEDKEEAR